VHPYKNLPERQFWKSAVSVNHFSKIKEIWSPNFSLNADTLVASYGSCFAQYIGRRLDEAGYSWNITETAPGWVDPEVRRDFGYEIFPARTGNIYTASSALQWLEGAVDKSKRCYEMSVDTGGGGVRDYLRSRLEPEPFGSVDECTRSLDRSYDCFLESISTSEVLIFTLGLTERWVNSASGYEYPVCPGTVIGVFDGAMHKFHNLKYHEILASLQNFLAICSRINKSLQIVFTVSPVPLTATFQDDHVLVASSYSKSVLRAVVGELVIESENVNYFPSYEMFSSPKFAGTFYDVNGRSVTQMGVDFVMEKFFHPFEGDLDNHRRPETGYAGENVDANCDEAFLEFFRGA